DDNHEPVPGRAGGGLASTLGAGVRGDDTVWVAATMNDADRAAAKTADPEGELRLHGYRLRLVDVAAETYAAAYNVVANETLWFWHHHMFDSAQRPRLDSTFRAAWESFRELNQSLATAGADAAERNATVLVHDYQMALVPGMLRALRPDLKISHFTHTPWVHPALMGLLPDDIVEELLLGMGGADACGFHAPRWAEAFEGCWRAHPGTRDRRMPRTYVAPAAADHDEVATVAASPECARETAIFNAAVGHRKCIVRVDRIEPSKNLLRGLWAYRELLSLHPQWRDNVTLVAMCYPSRESLAEYQQLHHDVVEAAAALNREFGTDDWPPVILDTNDDFARSVAGLRRADVLLVNPIRDGLNLVAYEGTAINERNAPLVLSREAGAWDEFGPAGAIGVNPFDVVGTAEALHLALSLDDAERAARYAGVHAVATARTPEQWLAQQIAAAQA
ncbi:MAG TPA: trehalose-6-phosphate synthase, partial [Acidimicrobiales bacterium]|nr:trehalose-6-phosphate synthase [Acidimicrobiales bacterium]